MVTFELDVKTRRTAFMALLGVAGLAFLTAILVTVLAVPSAGAWLLASVIVLVAALAGEIFLLVYGESKDFDDAGEWYNWESEAKPTTPLLLRCSGCRETFTIQDSGERPLRHACPHCGRNGVLKGESKAPTAPQQPGGR